MDWKIIVGGILALLFFRDLIMGALSLLPYLLGAVVLVIIAKVFLHI